MWKSTKGEISPRWKYKNKSKRSSNNNREVRLWGRLITRPSGELLCELATAELLFFFLLLCFFVAHHVCLWQNGSTQLMNLQCEHMWDTTGEFAYTDEFGHGSTCVFVYVCVCMLLCKSVATLFSCQNVVVCITCYSCNMRPTWKWSAVVAGRASAWWMGSLRGVV